MCDVTHLVKKILSVQNIFFLPVSHFFQKLDNLVIVTHDLKSVILKEVD